MLEKRGYWIGSKKHLIRIRTHNLERRRIVQAGGYLWLPAATIQATDTVPGIWV